MYFFLLKKAKVDVVNGKAELKDKNTIIVGGNEIKAKYIIIATAGEARHWRGEANKNLFVTLSPTARSFGGWLSKDRATTYIQTSWLLEEGSIDPITILQATAEIFNELRWNGGYGGVKWAKIAEEDFKF